jgi:adenylylsulfate kinase-like enzyme
MPSHSNKLAIKFPRVLWITGLSGAGKSSLANILVNRLKEHEWPVVLLDGDELRKIFGSSEGEEVHGREHRVFLAQRYSQLCRLLADQGITVIIATISLFHEIHQQRLGGRLRAFNGSLLALLDLLVPGESEEFDAEAFGESH